MSDDFDALARDFTDKNEELRVEVARLKRYIELLEADSIAKARVHSQEVVDKLLRAFDMEDKRWEPRQGARRWAIDAARGKGE